MTAIRAALRHRGVLKMHGRDVVDFMHAMTTADAKTLGLAKPYYAAMLNHKGRVMFDMFVHPAAAGGGGDVPTLLLEMDREHVPDVISHLKDYKLRKKVKFEDLSESTAVVVASSSDAAGAALPTDSSAWVAPLQRDPRPPVAEGLGLSRGIVAADAVASDATLMSNDAATTEYRRQLYRLGVAEGQDAFIKDKSLPFDANLDLLDGVSFHKGCYVGQELTHRTHVMLVVRKRLVGFSAPAVGASVDPARLIGKSIASTKARNSCGRVMGWAGEYGVGYFRLPNMEGAGDAVFTVGEGSDAIEVRPSIPAWWPEETLKVALEKSDNKSSD